MDIDSCGLQLIPLIAVNFLKIQFCLFTWYPHFMAYVFHPSHYCILAIYWPTNYLMSLLVRKWGPAKSPIHPESNTWQSEKYMAFYSCGFSILTRFYAEGSWSPQFIPSDVTNPANTPWWLSEVTKFNYSLPWCQIKHCIKRQRKSSHSTGR